LECENAIRTGPTPKSRHAFKKPTYWLEYDAIALVVVIVGLAAVALLAFSI
jgi:hypothetical protein